MAYGYSLSRRCVHDEYRSGKVGLRSSTSALTTLAPCSIQNEHLHGFGVLAYHLFCSQVVRLALIHLSFPMYIDKQCNRLDLVQ